MLTLTHFFLPISLFLVAILSRYPDVDYEDFPLTTEHLPMFCLPVGVSVEVWNEHTSFPLPTFSTFVLTSTEAIKMYGATVLFYEPLLHHDKMAEIRKHVGASTHGDETVSGLIGVHRLGGVGCGYCH